jgi:dolichol-phosphate mannosyltransferase
MAWTNFIAHHVICVIAWMVTGIRVHDVMAGFKAFRRECALSLDLRTHHFGYEAEILVRAGQLGYQVAEVPVTFLRRKEGQSNVKKFRDGCRVLSTIARTALRSPKPAPRDARRAAVGRTHALSPA